MEAVTESDEDARWREIVENYGERVELGDEPPPAPADPWLAPDLSPGEPVTPESREDPAEEGFVPPAPPPVPRPAPPRLVAWLGLFGAPLLLLAAVVTQVRLPALLTYGLLAWFVGGFAFLVVSLPNEPRDPGDDGARL